MGRKDIMVRENRIRALTAIAVDLLKRGVGELDVEEHLREVALDNWGVSTTTLYNYAAAALRRAKKQLGSQQQGEGGAESEPGD